MPWDIRLPFGWSGSGDAETVQRMNFYEQVIQVICVETIKDNDFLGSSHTTTDIADLESRLESAINRSQYFTAQPVVTIQAVREYELVLRVALPDGSTTLDVDVPME